MSVDIGVAVAVRLRNRYCWRLHEARCCTRLFWPLDPKGLDYFSYSKISLKLPEQHTGQNILSDSTKLRSWIINHKLLLDSLFKENILFRSWTKHHQILRNGVDGCYRLHSMQARSYRSFEAVNESHNTTLQNRSLEQWNFIISKFSGTAMCFEVFHMFTQTQLEGLFPDKGTFMQVVSACRTHADINEGKRMHARIRFSPFKTDLYLGTAIMSMYDKCKSLDDACRTWLDMPIQSEVTWTTIISCHVHHGQHNDAFCLFIDMIEQGIDPNIVTFICILEVFMTPLALTGGQMLHHFIVEHGFESNIKICTPLVCMYKNCGSFADANFLFFSMFVRNRSTWNAMISMYQKKYDLQKVLEFFDQFQTEGFLADHITFLGIIGTFCSTEDIKESRRIHVRVLHSGFLANMKVITALINLYGRLCVLEYIDPLLDRLNKLDVVLCTSLIDMYSQHGQTGKAIEWFYRMQEEGIEPSEVTFTCIIDACQNPEELVEARHAHSFIIEKGYDADIKLGNTLLASYGRLGCFEDAICTFGKLPVRSVVSWGALMTTYVQHGLSLDSLRLFSQMLLEGIRPSVVIFLSIFDALSLEAVITHAMLVHSCVIEYGLESDESLLAAVVCMYSNAGSLEDLEGLIDGISEDKEAFWNSKIILHAQKGKYEDVFQSFSQAEGRGIHVSHAAYACILDVCNIFTMLEDTNLIYFSLICDGCDSIEIVSNALLSTYGVCGDLRSAWRIFECIVNKSVASWTTMIALNGQHGLGQEAFMLFNHMQTEGIIPNVVTLCALLEAFNHSGLLMEALGCLRSFIKDFSPVCLAEAYVPVVDLLGRIGCLDDVQFLINNIPCQPLVHPLTVLLNACYYHTDIDRAQHTARFVLELDPDSATSYVTLSNIFAYEESAYLNTNYREFG
ncbi:hypothetical protein KP509_26G016100 [Ceratopteris richardii]|nr:hypothetical protein KP509_26G016100 [Ceratopteris richardii]